MKNTVICIICLAVSLFGCLLQNGDKGVKGSGTLKEESREIGAFSKLMIAGAFHVEAIPGDEPSVHLSAEDNLLPLIQTRIEGDTLVLDTKENLAPTLEMKVKLTFIDMESLSSYGANFVMIEGARSERFDSTLRGAGLTRITGEVEELKVEDVVAEDLVVDGKKIASSRDIAGLTAQDIMKLQVLHKEGKIPDKIRIKWGVRFAPIFLLAYILSVLYGNAFELLIAFIVAL